MAFKNQKLVITVKFYLLREIISTLLNKINSSQICVDFETIKKES